MITPLLTAGIVAVLLFSPIPFDDLLIPYITGTDSKTITTLVVIMAGVWYYKSMKK